jgi:hypothetical protein
MKTTIIFLSFLAIPSVSVTTPTKSPDSLFNLCGQMITDAVVNDGMRLEHFNQLPQIST